ncbi:MAG: zinc ribbon domain-containing protein [Candidatus Hodarchaeota archaeon]
MNDDYDFLKENPFIVMAIGGVFLVVFIVGLVFTLISDDTSFWTTGWAIIPGGILLAIGIVQYFQRQNYEKMVLAILKNYEGSTVTLQDLSEQLDIDIKLLRKVLLRLQGTGKLACRIDRGEINVLSVLTPRLGAAARPILAAGPSRPELASEGDFVYCPFCGAKNPEKAIFCKNCGQAFQ